MKQALLYLLIFSLITSCHRQTNLQRLCAEIRSIPQKPFPFGDDKKWQALNKLKEIKDKDLPDSVKNLFAHIDTSIRGYYQHYRQLINLLSDPDSRRSLQAMAALFKEYTITDPDCSQALSACFFMNDENLLNLAVSYVTKRDMTNYKNLLKNTDVMFPDLARILGRRPFSDRPILDIMKKGLEAHVLNSENLASSKPELLRFYHFLKYTRDTLSRQPIIDFSYKGYYQSHIDDLLFILKIFEPDSAVGQVFREAGYNGKTP